MKKKNIELLKRSQDLKNQKKNLFIKNQEEDFELSEYNIAVEEHIFWQDRDQVALLMEDFLNKKIDSELFSDQVYGLHRKLINTCEKFKLELTSSSEKIKDFQPDGRSKKLSGFLTDLYCECEYFTEAEDYQNKKFYDSIKNGFLNFQKYLNEE
uniref:hypothetical protein n=1 Tax=Nitzschia dubiiformis TaxID=515482 RepID=UPI0021142968|nr:hypothetical protein NRL27_pgp011 [Nitzschia dubiiformis]UTQ75527.1 hypothetical protein [Nitzschia dubiiformis]